MEEYAYAIPSELEGPSDFLSGRSDFYAERYGGTGIGKHGGAGRCGTRGKFQLKGIGRTPLLDSGAAATDFWHSHGCLSLPEAIQEVIWGEIFTIALPFGAARIAAIIATGTDCWYESANGDRHTTPRALVVREATFRPAHFMRAPYFRAAPGVEMEHDADRVRRCIANLPKYLPVTASGAYEISVEELISGIETLVCRYAEQCATALSRRLMHGALYPSNLSLDGRWVDFGTATQLPTYANTKSCGAPRTFATLWEEHKRIEPIIVNLCFYIQKYFPQRTDLMKVSPTNIIRCYRSKFGEALKAAMIQMLGIPASLLASSKAQSTADSLAEILVNVLKLGNEKQIESAIPDLSSFGKNDIGVVIMRLAQHSNSPACGELLQEFIALNSLRNELITRFNDFISALAEEGTAECISEQRLRTLCYIGGLKANRTIPELYRVNIKRRCAEIAFEHRSADELRDEIHQEVMNVKNTATTLYSQCSGLEVTAWKDAFGSLNFDARSGNWLSRTSRGTAILHDAEGRTALHNYYSQLHRLSTAE